MRDSLTPKDQNQAVFLELAELVNALPLEKRVSIRSLLGEYTHDLKHLIGLITGANALLTRQQVADEYNFEVMEMVEMIGDAAMQIDAQIDRLTMFLSQQILIEEK